jgi:hypothetical protein
MAKPITSMFTEVKYELTKILLLNVFFETAIVFLAIHLIFSVFSMSIWYSVIVAIIFFGARFWRGARQFNLKRIEDKNPELREMLRTASDNQGEDNLMAHALFHDVLKKMRKVSSGTFLDMNKLVKRIGVIFVLSVVLVSIAFFNLNVAKFEDPLKVPVNALGDLFRNFRGGELHQEEIDLGDDSLYGEARMADLSAQELQLRINPSLNEIDFSNLEDPDRLGDSIEDYPGEAEAIRDTSYTEGLEDVIDRKTAAEYSQEVKKQ